MLFKTTPDVYKVPRLTPKRHEGKIQTTAWEKKAAVESKEYPEEQTLPAEIGVS